MGLAGIADWSTQLPFIDLMKQARPWQDWNHPDYEFDLDDNDWVKTLPLNRVAGTIFLTLSEKGAMPFNRVYVLYDGDGQVGYSYASKKDIYLSTPERDVVDLGVGVNALEIQFTNPKNPIRNIKIIPEPYYEAYLSGKIFNPQWVEYVEGFQAFRFMNWMKTTASNQKAWNDRPRVDSRSWQSEGVPLEVMVYLVNQLKVDPWFNIPHLADINYIRKFGEYLKRNLDSSLQFYVEHSNEVWNWGFEQSQYAIRAAKKRWNKEGDGFMQWHGMRTAQMCDVFKQEIFSSDKQRVKCVLGIHPGWRDSQIPAMLCPEWVKEGNEPCYKHGFDFIGTTSYFTGGLNGPPHYEEDPKHISTLKKWLNKKDGGLTLAFEQLETGNNLRHLKNYKDFEGVYRDTLENLKYWVDYARKHGMNVVAYEGGQHISANALKLQDDEGIVNFHIAMNRDQRMEKIYRELLRAWKDSGAQLHVHYLDVGPPSKFGSWGALENLNQRTSPKWRALTDFNENIVCWWDGCKGVVTKKRIKKARFHRH